MRKIFKKLMTFIMISALTLNVFSINASAASSSGKTYINNTYGNLVGSVYAGVSGAKFFSSVAQTSKKVTKIRAKLAVYYSKSGVNIGPGENSGWVANSSSAQTYDYDLHHWNNKEKQSDYYFVNTKCVGYGTADAIIENAYVVYTSLVY